MNQLIQDTNQLFVRVQSSMDKLDSFAHTNQCEMYKKEEEYVKQMLNQAAGNCDRLEVLMRKEPISTRSTSKLRVDQLRYDLRHIQSAVQNIDAKMARKQREAKDRDLLMATNFVSNRSGGNSDSTQTRILIDQGLQDNDRLSSSVRHMDQLLSSGSNVITSLADQRSTLKSAHKRMLNMLNTLGLSSTLMRMIERRSSQDWIIFCVGCFCVLLLIVLLWIYVI